MIRILQVLVYLSTIIFWCRKPLIPLSIIVQRIGQVFSRTHKGTPRRHSQDKGRGAVLSGVQRCKPLNGNGYSAEQCGCPPSSDFKGVGGGVKRLVKKAPPGQTLFSNFLFFQPESHISKFFPGATPRGFSITVSSFPKSFSGPSRRFFEKPE